MPPDETTPQPAVIPPADEPATIPRSRLNEETAKRTAAEAAAHEPAAFLPPT